MLRKIINLHFTAVFFFTKFQCIFLVGQKSMCGHPRCQFAQLSWSSVSNDSWRAGRRVSRIHRHVRWRFGVFRRWSHVVWILHCRWNWEPTAIIPHARCRRTRYSPRTCGRWSKWARSSTRFLPRCWQKNVHLERSQVKKYNQVDFSILRKRPSI